jgi:hypothetical protein
LRHGSSQGSKPTMLAISHDSLLGSLYVLFYQLKNNELPHCIIYIFYIHMSIYTPCLWFYLVLPYNTIGCNVHTTNRVHCFVGLDAKKCMATSKTYRSTECHRQPCVEACHKEGFTEGKCFLEFPIPVMTRCYCRKDC